MNTVIAADAVQRRQQLQHHKSGTVGRNQALHYFFHVPAGTPAFKVDSRPITPRGHRPGAVPALPPVRRERSTDNSEPDLLLAARRRRAATGSPLSRTTSQPAGRRLGGHRRSAADLRRREFTPFTLTASILGATVSPNPDIIASRDDRRPGRPLLHDDQHLRRVHRTGRRDDARQRAGAAPSRSPTSHSSSTRRP